MEIQTTLLNKEAKEKAVEIITKPEYRYICYKDAPNICVTDASAIEKEKVPNVVWVEGEQEGLYGIQKIVSVNNKNSLVALPTLKDLNKLEVGKYYRIMLEKIVHFGHRRKKVISIEEIDYKTYQILSLEFGKHEECYEEKI